ncbi:hypothetical protein GCM10022254_03250 [Actinomadura meridiana]|uniref:Uncharacterized protein n=1 Tax=Actinomadura meridiana TaxID=559626 RepID=A0ABP8BS64_9ACTN
MGGKDEATHTDAAENHGQRVSDRPCLEWFAVIHRHVLGLGHRRVPFRAAVDERVEAVAYVPVNALTRLGGQVFVEPELVIAGHRLEARWLMRRAALGTQIIKHVIESVQTGGKLPGRQLPKVETRLIDHDAG